MVDKPEGSGVNPSQQGSVKGPSPSRVGPLGYGSGPLLAAGVMTGGALLFAGWGAVQIATADEAPKDPPAVSAPATPGSDDESSEGEGSGGSESKDGEVTVTLPDEDGNGVADVLEEKEGDHPAEGDDEAPSEEGESKGDSADGKGDEESQAPRADVYVIESGDTLTEISGETGVPIDILIEENHIKNPNLIYAGASLLIPPVG